MIKRANIQSRSGTLQPNSASSIYTYIKANTDRTCEWNEGTTGNDEPAIRNSAGQICEPVVKSRYCRPRRSGWNDIPGFGEKGFQKGCTCTGGSCADITKCAGAASSYGADIGNMKKYSDMLNYNILYDDDDTTTDPRQENNVVSNKGKAFKERVCVMGPAGATTTLHRY